MSSSLRLQNSEQSKSKLRYDYILFDLDGTILNTLDDLHASVNYALDQYSFPARSLDEVRLAVGDGVGKLIERSVPKGTDFKICEEVLICFKQHYSEHGFDLTQPYPDIMELLDELRSAGAVLAVVSNKHDAALQELVARYFPDLFDAATGFKDGWAGKPAPDSCFAIMEQIGAVPERSCYIGDSDIDVFTAQNAHIDCIAVTWGFRDEDVLRTAGATTIVQTPNELLKALICD